MLRSTLAETLACFLKRHPARLDRHVVTSRFSTSTTYLQYCCEMENLASSVRLQQVGKYSGTAGNFTRIRGLETHEGEYTSTGSPLRKPSHIRYQSSTKDRRFQMPWQKTLCVLGPV